MSGAKSPRGGLRGAMQTVRAAQRLRLGFKEGKGASSTGGAGGDDHRGRSTSGGTQRGLLLTESGGGGGGAVEMTRVDGVHSQYFVDTNLDGSDSSGGGGGEGVGATLGGITASTRQKLPRRSAAEHYKAHRLLVGKGAPQPNTMRMHDLADLKYGGTVRSLRRMFKCIPCLVRVVDRFYIPSNLDGVMIGIVSGGLYAYREEVDCHKMRFFLKGHGVPAFLVKTLLDKLIGGKSAPSDVSHRRQTKLVKFMMAEQASHTRHMIREVVDDVVGHKIAELERGISSALANAVRRIEEVSEQRSVGRGGAAEEIRRRSSSSMLRAAASLEVPVEERMRDQQVRVTFFTFCLHMSLRLNVISFTFPHCAGQAVAYEHIVE